ncbi:ABC transporter ATP-binding protein [Paenibacillus sp. MER TA 81-3]|uniref:ABC transporter ATP-binding protein n=1 Tax=Paenibacillus sp. MER TA 81-3 TaxID=2939573 RepID=UPI002040F884|nr:ABC transporter ATP-binding protein [Paenibacillus sp. MER TA 81-3]
MAAIVYFCVVLVLVVNIDQSNLEVNAVNHFKNKNLYQISDNLYGETETMFFSEKNSVDILNDFVTGLAVNFESEYYKATWQPIGISNFKGDVIFDAYYESGSNKSPYVVNNKSYKDIKSIQLNSNVFDMNQVQISVGKKFDNDDYIFDKYNNNIPVILGSELDGVYQLGETLDILYYRKEFKGEIIGFLDSSQKIMTTKEPETILDRYIILPIMRFTEVPAITKENKIFVIASLLSQTNGRIVTDATPLEIRKKLDEIATKANFKEFSVIGANGIAINSIVRMTETNRSTLFVCVIAIFTISTILFMYTTAITIRKNVETYKVLLISGFSLEQIYKMVGYKLILTSVVGSILPIIPLLFIVQNPFNLLLNYLFAVLISSLLMLVIITMFTRRTFNRIDIVQKLKG